MFPLSDPDHPYELVDIVTGVADGAPEYDEHVVDVQHRHDLVGGALVARHRLADQRYVRVVPRVVVHQGRAVPHAGDLATLPFSHTSRFPPLTIYSLSNESPTLKVMYCQLNRSASFEVGTRSNS